MKKRLFVECGEEPDFVVYDFGDPHKTEIAPGSHALFSILDVETLLPGSILGQSRGALVCTYRPDDLPQPPDLVTRESLLPVSVRCATDEQLKEKRGRLLQLALVEEPPAGLPISSQYKLVARAAKPARPVDRAWFGGTFRWRGDPLSIDAPFLFVISMDVMNANINNMRQLSAEAETHGIGFIDAPVQGFGPCGFCLSRSQ